MTPSPHFLPLWCFLESFLLSANRQPLLQGRGLVLGHLDRVNPLLIIFHGGRLKLRRMSAACQTPSLSPTPPSTPVNWDGGAERPDQAWHGGKNTCVAPV
uniref:Secreted protein n=1 Tax=Micrurus lemniscatus lemniscatus TaxID=129467 RepID=A0A2D4HVV1_MICLE